MKPTIDLLSVTFHYSPVLLRHTAAPILFALIAAAVLTALPAESAQHNVPLFISGANNASGQQGFVRIVNHSDWGGAFLALFLIPCALTYKEPRPILREGRRLFKVQAHAGIH